MWRNILLVGAGSFVGGALRYSVSLLLKYLANLAVERHCGRMEWICLDWNQSALNVYRSIGAIPMDEWTVQRLDESSLKQIANC